MSSIITVITEDAEAVLAALAPLAKAVAPAPASSVAPTPVSSTASIPAPATRAPVTVSSVQAQIQAVSFTDGTAALTSLFSAFSSGASSLPSDALLTAETLIGLVDPELIAAMGGINAILPLATAAIGFLSAGAASNAPYFLGAPRAIGIG